MKLPKSIQSLSYDGPRDDNGYPHGYGMAKYATTTFKKYRYKGHFVHGVRSGYGVWYELSHYIREYEEWEWVQMGEYDSCGRLIHPNTKPGPRKEVIESWDQTFSGWWRNDEASHKFDYTRGKYSAGDLELTEDNKFLTYFHDFKAIRKLPKSMVSKLKRSTKPGARYGYGVWLWLTHKDSESLKTAFKIFEESAANGIADALHLLSRMYYLGEAYDEHAGKFVMDRKLSMELQAQAIEKGSITAKLRRNKDLYLGSAEFKADKETAIAVAERESSAVFSESILWTEQLGWFYQLEGETEKAVNAYDKCIVNGYYVPIFNLALIALDEDDFEYYETLMNIGMKLEIPECYALGFEQESCWESLNDQDKLKIHARLKRNLPEGVLLGSAFCAYLMADVLMNGKFGFDIDFVKGKEYADIALTYGYNDAANLLIEAAENLQDLEFMSDEELLRLRYDALRYGVNDQLDYVIKNKDTYVAMGYGDDMESTWMPLWKKRHPSVKTQIAPSVIRIQPSGEVSVIEADIFAMSYREMCQLLDAEGLDAVHFSEPLNQITKNCGFKGYQLAMYTDRNGYAKDLPDNAIGTILYGHGAEIRGAVLIALEDNKYDTHSFHFQEDIEQLLAEISKLCGNLLKR